MGFAVATRNIELRAFKPNSRSSGRWNARHATACSAESHGFHAVPAGAG
jgi:hypothetical protein